MALREQISSIDLRPTLRNSQLRGAHSAARYKEAQDGTLLKSRWKTEGENLWGNFFRTSNKTVTLVKAPFLIG